MKSIFFLSSFLLLLNGDLFAQSETMDRRVGFGGPSLVNTTLAGEWALEVGGLGGGFITREFYIGGAGFGLSQQIDDYEYNMGYGGLMLGYLWQGEGKTGLNFYLLGGYGSITEKGESRAENSDDFWVLRPAIEVDFLLMDWLRLGIGGGYRWAAGANLTALENSDMSAPFGNITLRFGNWRK